MAIHPEQKDWHRLLTSAEVARGFNEGFKFQYSPWSTRESAQAAFLSLNPGAKVPLGANRRLVSDERGNSYEVEQHDTRSPLTAQFLKLARFLDLQPIDFLAGVVFPFRTAQWKDVGAEQRRAGLDLARKFWGEPLKRPDLRLIVCVSAEAAVFATQLLNAKLEQTIHSGWGSVSLRRFVTSDGKLIVQLPHLSTYKLFGRVACLPALQEAFRSGHNASTVTPPQFANIASDANTMLPTRTVAAKRPSENRQSMVSTAALFRAIQNHPDFRCIEMTQQHRIEFRETRVGGLNTKINEWYVSKQIVKNLKQEDFLASRGFRRREKGSHLYWSLPGSGNVEAYRQAIEHLTGQSISG